MMYIHGLILILILLSEKYITKIPGKWPNTSISIFISIDTAQYNIIYIIDI